MKTSYYAIANPIGGIAISRYPPTGWAGLHYPDLAPNADLLNGFKRKQYTIGDYNKIYQQQLDKLDQKKVWSDLHALANAEEPTLLCFEKPKVQLAVTGYEPLPSDLNQWFCHRRLVANWLESSVGESVPEVVKEKSGFKHLGFIRSGLDDLKAWCRAQQPTEKPTVSSYARGRYEKWLEIEFKLTTPVEVIPAEHDERIYQLGQRLYPGNHSSMALK